MILQVNNLHNMLHSTQLHGRVQQSRCGSDKAPTTSDASKAKPQKKATTSPEHLHSTAAPCSVVQAVHLGETQLQQTGDAPIAKRSTLVQIECSTADVQQTTVLSATMDHPSKVSTGSAVAPTCADGAENNEQLSQGTQSPCLTRPCKDLCPELGFEPVEVMESQARLCNPCQSPWQLKRTVGPASPSGGQGPQSACTAALSIEAVT